MANSQLVIFSDSDALIGDIEYVFRDRLDFISSHSLSWVKDYLHNNNVKLLIADMDMKTTAQTEILDSIRELGAEETAVLFLASEAKMLELTELFREMNQYKVSADWLIKPFSRNALISSVGQLYG